MVSGLKTGFWRRLSKAFQDWELLNFGVLLHRLWIVLLILALPFLLIMSAGCFETLERSGTVGAIIADTMLPATLVGYLVLIYVLNKRRI